MAKRKRLTVPKPEFLDTSSPASPPAPPPALPPIAQVAGEASARAALDELSQTMAVARDSGRLIQELPLDAFDAGHLVRDRLETGDSAQEAALEDLIASLRARGQQTPIEVVDNGPQAQPRYGLISGWRRLAALRRIARDRPATKVLALIRAPQSASDAYVAMVEENEIRLGLSYYERGRIVVKAVEQGVYPDRRTALQTLFANVSRAKRSKIGSFATIVTALDGALHFPTAMGERLGLELARWLGEDPRNPALMRADLRGRPPVDAAEEQARLSAVMAPKVPNPVAAGQGGKTGDSGEIVVTFDPDKQRLELAGAGVTPGLHAALRHWLKRRG